MKYKKVLVTGGAGCIGIQVCNQLIKRGIDVVLYDLSEQISLTEKFLDKKIILKHGSIMDRTSLRDSIIGCDAVIHLAAHLGVMRTESNKLRCLEINIEGTKNVLEAVVNNNNVKKLVFASSSEVYGEPLTNPIKEDAVTQGRTLYAVSKLAGEELIKAYKYEFKGFDYTILRYFNTYGPYQVAQFVIPRFIHRTLNDKSPVINGIGNQKRSYSFSSDTARATIDSLFSNKTNDVIMNIGNSNEPVTLLELANKIIQASGKKGKIKAKINKEFSNTDREADREINFRYCDTTLAKKLLNYEPETSLDEGIKKVMDAGYIPLSWITSEKNYLIDE